MTECLVLVDYNNPSRVPDVRAIFARAKELKSVLIRGKLDPVDSSLADHVFEMNPASPTFVAEARRALEGMVVKAVLPFSDRAIVGASRLAESYGLTADSSKGAQAALSKLVYRDRETSIEAFLAEQGIMAPKARRISSLPELQLYARTVGRDFILKPACEGNNRGVLRLGPESRFDEAFKEVERYLDKGVLCEELIPFPEEYSFDGVGHLSFVTEKLSAKGRYPVERGQRVPARGGVRKFSALERAGRVANLIVGQRRGAFHNEIKYDPATHTTAVVEPNRRPAGMRIWDLAAKVYGVNFYSLWVDASLGRELPERLPAANGAAAIRMLGSPKDGVLTTSLGENLLPILADGLPGDWFHFEISAEKGQTVHRVPKDNSHFLGSVSVHHSDPDALLDIFESRWNQLVNSLVSERIEQCVSSAF